nr:putative ABC exporter domain-containing protein [Lachnospiraceae bacterium]
LIRDTKLSIDPFIVPGALLLVIAFYRTLGNPLSEDTSREFFVLVPESSFKKIMASLLGSIVVTAIDLSVPIILSGVLVGTSPLNVIVWFVFLLSVSVFGTTVGTFINLSVPGDHAQTVKTMLQVIFIYFGMIPAAAFVVAGVLLGQVAAFLMIGAVCNLLLGMLFASLSPHFLMNR